MRLILVLLVVVMMFIYQVQGQGDWSTDEQASIQQQLNSLRNGVNPRPIGNSMNNLVWSPTLYGNANTFAQTCQAFTQNSYLASIGYLSENVFLYSTQPSVGSLIDSISAVNSKYIYDDTFCRQDNDCSSYINVITNQTTQFACSKFLCSENRWVAVCDYYPPGAQSGIPPYTSQSHQSNSILGFSPSDGNIDLTKGLKRRDDLHTASVDGHNFDWRESGVVVQPEDSVNCAAGWAFTAQGIFESRVAMRNEGSRPSYSKQQLIDCFAPSAQSACSMNSTTGNLLNYAVYYLQQNGTMRTEDYPYVGAARGPCRYNASNLGAHGGDVEVSNPGRDGIVDMCRSQGPVGIGMYVPLEFFDYSSGIFTCNNSLIIGNTDQSLVPQLINHNVLLVGYTQASDNNNGYYIIKNNWSRNWGENGFARISALDSEDCLISRNGAVSLQIS
ncbi:hypothetical protein DLAC_09136 [Tieghemostelium lacteum]|uniref:Gamete and mating-type specific protein A n=1 Tax=Tieghemostelium lacteum TaxID=361077 RepID=A0A151Z973_TIELA|nr:hypothetical protein DLAC_09136 [Tieghemostelium lacteum]|eukprot:KYQ90509.1 hypothetical protein DLAC_09136 [Tieghemostelium lacteum]